jgi:hypothetical protein
MGERKIVRLTPREMDRAMEICRETLAELRANLAIAVEALEWYADFGAGAAKERTERGSPRIGIRMLEHDGGKRASDALAKIRDK